MKRISYLIISLLMSFLTVSILGVHSVSAALDNGLVVDVTPMTSIHIYNTYTVTDFDKPNYI